MRSPNLYTYVDIEQIACMRTVDVKIETWIIYLSVPLAVLRHSMDGGDLPQVQRWSPEIYIVLKSVHVKKLVVGNAWLSSQMIRSPK